MHPSGIFRIGFDMFLARKIAVLLALLVAANAPAALAQTNPGTSPLSIAKGGTGGATAPAARTGLGLGSIATQNANSVAITGGAISGMPTPSAPSDVATKGYADGLANGLHVLAASRLATAAVLPNTPTYANGASGVGATLTAGANSTLTVDGTVANLNDVILVQNQASAFQNGIYTVTTAGGGVPWVLTRATYFNQSSNMLAGSYTAITAGATNVNTSFVLASTVTTVGTTVVTFNLFSNSGVTSFNGATGPVTGVGSIGVSGSPLTGAATVSSATGMITQASQNIAFSLGNYTSSLTGGAARTVPNKLGDVIEAKDFGVVCDGSTATGTQLQNAISGTPPGGTLHISAQNTTGPCIVSKQGGNAYALTTSTPIHIVCDSGVAIKPDVSVTATTSVLYLFGSSSGTLAQTVIEGCFIGDTGAPTRNGLHGIVFDTQAAGVFFRAPIVKNVFIQAGTSGNGYGIYVINNAANNVNGGTYGAIFGEASVIQGGIALNAAGDSITIKGIVPHNGGAGADSNGIFVSLVSGAGALVFDNVNFSQAKGVKIDCAYNLLVNGGEYEGQATLTGNALFDVNAGGCTTTSVKIRNAQFQYNGGFGTPLLLRITSNVAAVVLDGNAFATPTGYTGVSNASATLQLGPNFWQTGATHISGTAAANIYGGG